MAKKPGNKMPVSERAKQFMPFSALTGLNRALAEKEREMIAEKKERLSEDQKALLDRKIRLLHQGETIIVSHYHFGRYRETEGRFKEIDPVYGVLYFENGDAIPFADIKDIK